MFGHRFYHQTTRRYVAMFGTLFNDIVIERKDNSGTVIQKMKVPIHYAPMQKVLSRIEQDPGLNNPTQMTLPRMSFEIVNYNFAPDRKLTSLTRNTKVVAGENNSKLSQFVPAPYDIEFQLNIMTKYTEDAMKIVEQILPFFKPDFTVSVKMVDDMDLYVDVPIILNNVIQDDQYEGDYQTRRVLTYTLSFTVKGYYFGPHGDKKIIKFAESNVFDTTTVGQANTGVEVIKTQPGMTANNEPTTVLADSIDVADIDADDNWGVVVIVEDPE